MKKILLGMMLMVGCAVNAAVDTLRHHNFFKTEGKFWNIVKTEPFKKSRAFKLAVESLPKSSISLSQLASFTPETLPKCLVDFMVKFAILDYLVPEFQNEYRGWIEYPTKENAQYIASVHDLSVDVDIKVNAITIQKTGAGGPTTLLNNVLKAIIESMELQKLKDYMNKVELRSFSKAFGQKVISYKESKSGEQYVLSDVEVNQAVYCILLDYFVQGFYCLLNTSDKSKLAELTTFGMDKIVAHRSALVAKVKDQAGAEVFEDKNIQATIQGLRYLELTATTEEANKQLKRQQDLLKLYG
jgi:hypothetical protein